MACVHTYKNSDCGVVIESPGRTQQSQKQTLSNIFHTKNASQLIPITHDEVKRWEILKTPWPFSIFRFYGKTGHALFCDAGENYEWRLHTVTFLSSPYEGKLHQTNDEPQNSKMVMNWAQEREKQAKTNPSLRKWNQFISIFMPVLSLCFNNYIGFFHASLAINRSYLMQNSIKTRGNLCHDRT